MKEVESDDSSITEACIKWWNEMRGAVNNGVVQDPDPKKTSSVWQDPHV